MPIPFIPLLIGAAVAGTAAYGIKKGIDAYNDNEKAGELHDRARSLYDTSERELDNARSEAQRLFGELGGLKKSIIDGSWRRCKRLIDQLDFDKKRGIFAAISNSDVARFETLRVGFASIESALGGLAGGATMGALAGWGAYGAVGLLGTASTGTAISTLSGVAATKATLAWLGGGSLAAGGLGIAGGTYVLGGIIAAPVIAVASAIWAANAETKRLNAQSYYNAVRVACEQLSAERLAFTLVVKKTTEQIRALRELDGRFSRQISQVEGIAGRRGFVVGAWSRDEQRAALQMQQLAEAVKAVLDAPILSKDDELVQKIKAHREKAKELFGQIQAKFG